MDFSLIPDGTVTSVPGFVAGAVHAGIKDTDELDLAILYSKMPCAATGVFTTNLVKSAPIILSQRHLTQRKAMAIVVNSGCANACLGEQGMIDASEMASLTATKVSLPSQEVLVASTGVIGKPLPMSQIRNGIEKIELHQDGGHELARAMMTTDTTPKEIAIQVEAKEGKFTIGGVAKGAGMMHPELATMLCFITTDAAVNIDFLQQSLKKAANASFNMLSIDGETSPNDCIFLLANSLARNTEISFNNGEDFQNALNEACIYLAKSIAQDGEGATKFIEVIVEGAVNQTEARQAARTIVSSPLVKAAMHGGDPNWGRIVAALGRSGAKIREDKLDVHLNDICVMKQGSPTRFDAEELRTSLARANNVPIKVYLNLGDGRATAWGCDLSEEYVTINSEHIT